MGEFFVQVIAALKAQSDQKVHLVTKVQKEYSAKMERWEKENLARKDLRVTPVQWGRLARLAKQRLMVLRDQRDQLVKMAMLVWLLLRHHYA